MIECDLQVVESESEGRSVRKSEGENTPDAHPHTPSVITTTTKLIHAAHPTPNSLSTILTDNISNTATHPPSIEFHTATDICFEIYLQIIYITHDVVITPSCFTTCASTCASRSGQEVVKK